MKIGLGIAAAGLAAGGIFWAVGGKSEESAKPPEKPKSAFATPCTDPGAEWQREAEPFMGSGARGFLDGPRRGVVWGRATGVSRIFPGAEAGPYGCYSYDPASERLHQVAGSAYGLLDGPFSRARFGTAEYQQSRPCTGSADGRYFFMSEPRFGGAIRRFDLKEQVVKTVPIPVRWPKGIAADSQGRLLVFTGNLELIYLDADGKEVEKKKLQDPGQGLGDVPGITLDEVQSRLYGSTGFNQQCKWYVWYWDLQDGSFHGVLPGAKSGEPKRKNGEAGPFEGTVLYPEMGTYFGPEDPGHNFLYVTPNDMPAFFRLDLAKKEIRAISTEGGKVKFIDHGASRDMPSSGCTWMDDGSFAMFERPFAFNGPQVIRYRRIK